MSGLGHFTQHSDSLQAGRSEDRILVAAKFSTHVQTSPEGPPSLLQKGYQVIHRGKAASTWHLPPTPKSYTSPPPLCLHGRLQGKLYIYLCLGNE
jgi:hypothetical protein